MSNGMASYRAAVIGLGRIGSTFDDEIVRGGTFFQPYCHAPSYYESPLVDLVAGADLSAARGSVFAERWRLDLEHVYTDYREMLAAERPDVVSVCTSARHRSAIVQEVARAGVKAIWAEKPMALSLAEADAMVSACREQGVALAVNCHRRWNAFFDEAKQIIDAGELGKLLQVTVYGTFTLSSNGSHMLDTLRFLAGGDVAWVFGEMESDAVAASDDDPKGNGYLAFDNGVRGYVRSMPSGAATTDFDVIGEQARLRTGDDGMSWRLTRLVPSDVESRSTRPLSNRVTPPLPVEYPFPLPKRIQGTGLAIVEDMIAAIETGRATRCSGEDGRAALEIAIAMRESHRRGGVKVSLPLEDRSLRIVSSDTSNDDVSQRLRAAKTTSR